MSWTMYWAAALSVFAVNMAVISALMQEKERHTRAVVDFMLAIGAAMGALHFLRIFLAK